MLVYQRVSPSYFHPIWVPLVQGFSGDLKGWSTVSHGFRSKQSLSLPVECRCHFPTRHKTRRGPLRLTWRLGMHKFLEHASPVIGTNAQQSSWVPYLSNHKKLATDASIVVLWPRSWTQPPRGACTSVWHKWQNFVALSGLDTACGRAWHAGCG